MTEEILNFSPEFIRRKLGLHTEKKKNGSNLLTDTEKNTLARLNQEFNLNMRPDFQKTEEGLTLILEALDQQKYQKTQLHNCGVSMLILSVVCAKIFCGQDYRPHQLFNRVTMVRQRPVWVDLM